MGITLSVLGSGSRGNSIYLATERIQLLVDAGLSARETERRLLSIGVSPKDLNGIVVTHEHVDHVRGLGTLSRRYKLPVYMNKPTHLHLPESVGRLDQKEEFVAGRSFCIEDVTIHPFAISHDAADPVGFTLVNNSVKIGVCTDLGAATRLVHRHLERCSVIILEANHDMEMLRNGPYPWPVKQRIKSRLGHLSNGQAGELLAHVFSETLQQVILGHLSETNNTPEKAHGVFLRLFRRNAWEHLRLNISSQHKPLDMIELT